MSVPVGIQLFSVRNSLAADPEGTFARLAELGFNRVEGANHEATQAPGIGFGIEPERLKRLLRENGLQIIGSHINPLDVNILGPVLDFHAEVGNPGIGCDIEFYPYGDLEYVKRRAETFNKVGKLAAERGMDFYYHNHFQEFQEFDGKLVYEVLLEETDPELVKIEMDTFWVYRGGHDPIEWINRYRDRVVLTHQKDFPDIGEPLNLFDGIVAPDANIDHALFQKVKNPLSFVEVGTGTLPIQNIIDTLAELPNFRYMLLEQDHSTLPELESVAKSKVEFGRFNNITFE